LLIGSIGSLSLGEYRRSPYNYTSSDTWKKRRQGGATKGFVNPRPAAGRPNPTARSGSTTVAGSNLPQAQSRHTESLPQAQSRQVEIAPPPPYVREQSPDRPPRRPDPDQYGADRLAQDIKNVRLVDKTSSSNTQQANSRVQREPSSRHADDSKSNNSGKKIPVPKKEGRGDSRHDDRFYH